MNSDISQLHKYIPLLRELVVRDLKIKYRRSFLGYLWSLMNPLLMMWILTIVFSYVFRFDIPNYPLYLIIGQVVFSFVSESTTAAMYSIIGNAALLKKVYVPKPIFPLAQVMSSFVTMLFSMVAIFIVMIVTGVALTPTLFL
ncbi:ABC transporter permease [uncultured Megasphaera sp.]|nr:ABC transporter permease [uncultured Megasphaera sp.]